MAGEYPIPTPKNITDLSGKRFGQQTVVGFAGKKGYALKWFVLCDCGSKRVVFASGLRSGGSESCGCVKKSKKAFSKTPEYKIWVAMRNRCNNPNNHHFGDYGGRGIRVCERWNSFKNFIEDMGERPSSDHSIDRINNESGYSKENCRWATRTEQARNRRSSKVIKHGNESKTLVEWSEITGIPADTISMRISSGWTVEKALSKKSQKAREK